MKQLLEKINRSFARKVARADKKYLDSEEALAKNKKNKKMVSFNTRIPKKDDTLDDENDAYEQAVGDKFYPNEKEIFSDTESDCSTDSE